MSAEANKAVVRHYYDIYRTGDTAALDQLLDSVYVDHDAVVGQAAGVEGVKHKVVGVSSDVLGD
jgi:hypothetical protein